MLECRAAGRWFRVHDHDHDHEHEHDHGHDHNPDHDHGHEHDHSHDSLWAKITHAIMPHSHGHQEAALDAALATVVAFFFAQKTFIQGIKLTGSKE